MTRITAAEDIRSAMLDVSRQLIAVNTVDPPGNEAVAAECIGAVLRQEGISFKLQEIAPGRTNLIARLPGSGGKGALVYSAHFDTISVNRPDWTVDPFGGEVRDGRLYGRGATDMKAAMAAMLYAAVALKRSGQTLRGDLILAFTAAENSSCLGAKAMADSDLLAGATALLISEPTSLDVFIAEKGALWLRATARGEYGHNAFSEERTGDRGSAILRMGEFLTRVRDLSIEAPRHEMLGPPTVNVGVIRGGVSTVLIADSCSADIDIRMVPGLSAEAVAAAFGRIAGPHVTIEILDYKPPVTTPADNEFVRLCATVCGEIRGSAPRLTGVPYYTDGAILAPRLGVPMVILGPGEVGKSGSVDEYVELAKLSQSLAMFLRIAEQYLA